MPETDAKAAHLLSCKAVEDVYDRYMAAYKRWTALLEETSHLTR